VLADIEMPAFNDPNLRPAVPHHEGLIRVLEIWYGLADEHPRVRNE